MNCASPAKVAKCLENANVFSAIHFNSRSLKKNSDKIFTLLHRLNHHFSIICFSETWLTCDDRDLYGFADYGCEYDHRSGSPYGGSAIFISKQLTYSRRNDLSINVPKCESVWVELDPINSFNLKRTVFGAVYRSPSSNAADFCDALFLVLDKLALENKNVFIMGDFNINLLDPVNPITSLYTSGLCSYGYVSLLNTPTRVANHSSHSLIDHIFSNHDSPVQTGTIDCDVTDHFPVFFYVDKQEINKKETYKQPIFDRENFRNIVSQKDWSGIFKVTNPDIALQLFSDAILNSVHDCTKFITSNRRYTAPRCPWLTNSLLLSLRKKDNLYKKMKRKPLNSNLLARYKRYSKVLSSLLKAAKRRYYDKELNKCGNNIKKKWKLVNEFLNNITQQKPIKSISQGDSSFTEPCDIAKAFSNHFSTIGSQLPSGPYVSEIVRSPQSFFLYPTCCEEIETIIAGLKTTGPGLDGIHGFHIKLVNQLVAPILCHIFNLVFKSGIFPQAFKTAKIIPVLKKGDARCMNNYRPISILSFLDKILEKLIESRLSRYLKKFDLLTPCQFGFRASLSTNIATACLTDKIKSFIDRGDVAAAVFIDLSKAFDTIDHDILFFKLERYGITGPALTLLRSFLLNRQQIVSVSTATSPPVTVNRGVPQGSILGPLLFLIYINDLPLHLNSSQCILYADDTTVFNSHSNLSTLIQLLQADLCSLDHWCLLNKLSINVLKTCFLLFSSPQKKISAIPSLYISGDKIEFRRSTNFLGLIVDSHLKFHEHATSISKKVAYGIRILIRARPFFNSQTLLTLYYAFVHSHLNYCISSWGSTYHTHIAPLITLQKQALRIITFSHRQAESFPLFCQLGVLPLYQLYRYSIGIFFFNIFYDHIAVDIFSERITFNSNSTRFASRRNLLLPCIHTNYGKHTIQFSAITLWNSLSPEIKSSNSLRFFKYKLKSWLLNSPRVIEA